MDRNNQIAAASISLEQVNVKRTFFLPPSATDICIIYHISILLLSTPKIKIREINLDYGKIVPQKLKLL